MTKLSRLKKRRDTEDAFTLVEVMVVMAVLTGMMMAVVLVTLTAFTNTLSNGEEYASYRFEENSKEAYERILKLASEELEAKPTLSEFALAKYLDGSAEVEENSNSFDRSWNKLLLQLKAEDIDIKFSGGWNNWTVTTAEEGRSITLDHLGNITESEGLSSKPQKLKDLTEGVL